MNDKNTYKSDDELKNLAPKLFSIKKENPYNTPADYFESLPDRVMLNLKNPFEVNHTIHIQSTFARHRIAISLIAASMLLFISIFILTRNESTEVDYFSAITFENIMDENPEMVELMDDHLLIEVLLTSSNYNEDMDLMDDLKKDSSLSTDYIIDYLLEENIETDLIYN